MRSKGPGRSGNGAGPRADRVLLPQKGDRRQPGAPAESAFFFPPVSQSRSTDCWSRATGGGSGSVTQSPGSRFNARLRRPTTGKNPFLKTGVGVHVGLERHAAGPDRRSALDPDWRTA